MAPAQNETVCKAVGGPASLVFRRGPESSTSLSELIDPATRIDPSALAAWVVGAPPIALERTPFRGIDAAYVTRPSGRPRRTQPSLADAPEALRKALVAAVDAALVGVRRVAVMTGGGIDSSVLLALTAAWAKRTGGSAFAVSLDFEGPGDDRPHLRALERHLGCEVLRVTPEDAADRMALLASGADGAPIWHPMMPIEVEMVTRARAHGAERVLCGGGADELFGGSPQALADIAWRGHPLRALRSARRLSGFGRPRSPAWTWVLRPLLGRALPTRLRGWRDRRDPRFDPPEWAGPVLRSFFAEQRHAAGVRVRRPPRTEDERFAAIAHDPYRVVLAWYRQQQERVTGVDLWWPYLDLDLAASVAELPADYLLYGDRWRGLLRTSIRDLVPDSLRERPDKAAFEPALRRFVDAAGGLDSLRPLASMQRLGALGIVDPARFASAFERFVAKPDAGEPWVVVWPALAVEAFLRGPRASAEQRRAS
ncbi:MAG: Asparagine synthetase [Labilithrix sp.]|nr:Asparagine synthetase [Labilithrix sp.]